MTVVSTRQLPWILAALLLALVPIYANTARTNDECGDGSRAARLSEIEGVERSQRYSHSIFQWTSREDGPGTLGHALIRARDAQAVENVDGFVRPRSIVPTRSELRRESHKNVELPIHFSYGRGEPASDFIAHLLLYRGRPVERILPGQLASVWEQLAFGRRPVTVLMAWAAGAPDEVPKLEEQATRWIVDAWKHFESRCGP